MRGLKLEFTESGVSLIPDHIVSGIHATAQNALVNVGTAQGSDRSFPDKGTELLNSAVRNGVPTQTVARHYANFAAVDTLFFLRDQDRRTGSDSLDMVEITPDAVDLNLAVFDIYLQFVGGQSLGRINTPYGVTNG